MKRIVLLLSLAACATDEPPSSSASVLTPPTGSLFRCHQPDGSYFEYCADDISRFAGRPECGVWWGDPTGPTGPILCRYVCPSDRVQCGPAANGCICP